MRLHVLTSRHMAPPAVGEYPDTLAVANLKGGVGKTTSTVFLSEAIALAGLSVAVLDADPQRSAAKWAERAALAGEPMSAVYFRPQAGEKISDAVDRARSESGAQVVLIDTPPGAGDRATTLAAVKASVGVVVPCRASVVEARELKPTLTLAKEAHRDAVVLRIAVDMRMTASRKFGEALEGAGIPVFRSAIPYNARMMEAGGTRPAPNKLYGYHWVWAEILGDDDQEVPI